MKILGLELEKSPSVILILVVEWRPEEIREEAWRDDWLKRNVDQELIGWSRECGGVVRRSLKWRYNIQMILRTQLMIHAFQEINQHSPRLLPNLTIGYDIYDTCDDVSLATRAALQLLRNQSDPQRCLIPTSINSSLPEPKTKVVIGERCSEVSIAIARIFALPSVTQISYGSTSELLSIKEKFPTFLRTVSSDKFQTK
ncbi:hypothetical protein AMECASPLE_029206, partial [Ameca splendens]